jgi:glycosyltransferase involved in cell wall biosynthesis
MKRAHRRELRIAQVAPLYETVPPPCYGGTERVVSYLTEQLVRLGHEVTLFATGDSVTQARLVAQAPRGLRLHDPRGDHIAHHLVMLAQAARRAAQFDIIQAHVDCLSFPMARVSATPWLTTLHGRLDDPVQRRLYTEYADVPVVSISLAQRLPVPMAWWAGNVPHGLPRDLYQFRATPGDYLAFLGRISPEKCADRAIRIAREAGLPLRIAAKVGDQDRAYFETVVKPLLAAPDVEFLGEVGEREKRELLGGARALLFPIEWPEPFGLVMIEALACGTPVLARARGSVPEVITDGVTGFVFETDEEAVRAARALGRLDRHRCREVFEQRFTVEVMADAYVEVYRQLLASPYAEAS